MFSGPYYIRSVKSAEFYFYRDAVKDPLSISLQYPSFGVYGHAEIPFEYEKLLNLWIASALSDELLSTVSFPLTMSWGAQGEPGSAHGEIEFEMRLDSRSRPICSIKAVDESQQMFYHLDDKRRVCITDVIVVLPKESVMSWSLKWMYQDRIQMLSKVFNSIPLTAGAVV